MLPDGAINAHRIWKRFRPDRNTSLARYELERLYSRVRRRPLDWQWALRDVSLEVEPGGAVGLVGNNGSGKSTLLKILTGVMYPYAGRVEVAGRIGALIEVKAGISPELTGRENIALYGTMLGLSRSEVSARFDQIVHFAQLEQAIDRQVKFYSSGMQMRLGFGVAAFLEPDVLLVDEVLAVGDAAFQQRCLERMREVLSQGTTLVFVSHDLAAVEAVTTHGVWLDKGTLAHVGPVRETLSAYRSRIEETTELESVEGIAKILQIQLTNPEGTTPVTHQPLDISMVIECDEARSCRMFVGISEGTADPIFALAPVVTLSPGLTEVVGHLGNLPLPRGRYFLWVGIRDVNKGRELLPWHPAAHMDVYGPDLDKMPKAVVRRAPIHVAASWDLSTVQDFVPEERPSTPSTAWGQRP